jgi:hypothetical protein
MLLTGGRNYQLIFNNPTVKLKMIILHLYKFKLRSNICKKLILDQGILKGEVSLKH